MPAQLGHAANVKKILNLIPQDASFSTSGYIFSHLWGRRNIIGLEVMQRKDGEKKVVDVDFALLDLWQLQQNNLKVPVDRGRVRGGVRFTDEALRRGLYGIAEVLEGVVLVQKGLPSKPEVLSGWSKLRQEIEPLSKESKVNDLAGSCDRPQRLTSSKIASIGRSTPVARRDFD